jgi:serine/threonine-protein kinase
MGRVYLAHDPEIDRPVAIKTVQIFESLPADQREEARERFLREARSAGRLLHPGIVTVFDVGESGDMPFIAMEYVEGIPLDAFCSPDRLLPVKTVVEMIAGVAEALHYAHGSDVVHRDIKPANLMRVGENSAKIMDFGLAKNPATQLTQEGALLGTPSYMSPEQIRGDAVDGRSDLFSLACVLYEMCTGEKAFGGDTISSVVYRIVNEDPRNAAEISERVPAGIAKFLERGLAKAAENRFPDGRAFAEALRASSGPATAAKIVPEGRPSSAAPTAARGKPKPKVAVPPPVSSRSRRRKSRAPIWVGLVVILAIAGAGGYYYLYQVNPEMRDRILAWFEPTSSEPPAPPPPAGLEARVRTEPAGLPVVYDGVPLEGDRVPVPTQGPYGVLSATLDCRTVTHEVGPLDAGGEIVLVTDPVETSLVVDPGVPGARVVLNGTDAGTVPADVTLGLCQDNIVEVEAEGYHAARAQIASGATGLEARTAVLGIELRPIPKGILEFPRVNLPVTFYVNGNKVSGNPESMELYEGQHELRIVSRKHFIDVRATARVRGGESVKPLASLPPMAELTVQSYPPNCKVYLRTGSQDWRHVAETPVSRYRVAAGDYQVRVEMVSTGAVREQELTLRAGSNPPVRVTFGG